jgi:hypothetical protein
VTAPLIRMRGAERGKNVRIGGPSRTRRWRPAQQRRTALVEALQQQADEAAARAADPALPRATRARYEGVASGIIAALEVLEELVAPDGRGRTTPA